MPEPKGRDVSLANLFSALLGPHEALLDAKRVSYERVHGRISSNEAFFQLTLNDAWFAWLPPLSQAIAKLHELSELEDAAPHDTIPALLASVQTLLIPSEAGEGFGRQYYNALQRSPDIVLAYADVRALLVQSLPPKGRVR